MLDSSELEPRKKRTTPSWFYFILVLMGSGILSLSDDKRIGIPFSREAYLACLVGIVVWYIFKHKHWFVTFGSVNYPILGYIVLTFTLPAIFALVKFGQPLVYGLLEERRTLFLLIFFPLFHGLCVKNILPCELIKYIKITAGLCILTAFMYYFGILRLNKEMFFSNSDLIAKHAWDLRYATRFRVGSLTIMFTALLILFQMSRSKISLPSFVLLLASVFYIYFLDQSRLAMLFIFSTGLFLWLTSIKFFMQSIVPITFSALVLMFLAIGTNALQAPIEKITFLLDDTSQPVEDRVRYKTSVIILHELMDNDFIGMGSLSNQWNSGFSSYYNKNFYLNDVGMLGLFYRFGILVFGIIFLYLYIFISAMKGSHSFEMKGLAWAYMMNILILLNFYTLLINGGQATGLLLAMLYYEKQFLNEQVTKNRNPDDLKKNID